MKKYLLATAALVALAAPAAAADMAARMPMKAPPMMAQVWNWTGFYIGANGGYGTGRNNWNLVSVTPSFNEGSFNFDGATAGGQIGYNWQVGGWVFGLEAQGNWADLKGSRNSLIPVAAGTAPFVNSTKIGAYGLFTGKVGYAWDNVLLYAKGGAAVLDVDYNWSRAGVIGGAANETRWGGTVGAGLEYAFSPNWSVGFEYNHIFATGKNVAFGPLPNSTDRIRLDTDLFTGRINYRFGGPVATRY